MRVLFVFCWLSRVVVGKLILFKVILKVCLVLFMMVLWCRVVFVMVDFLINMSVGLLLKLIVVISSFVVLVFVIRCFVFFKFRVLLEVVVVEDIMVRFYELFFLWMVRVVGVFVVSFGRKYCCWVGVLVVIMIWVIKVVEMKGECMRLCFIVLMRGIIFVRVKLILFIFFGIVIFSYLSLMILF